MRALLRAGWLALVLVVPQGVWAQADDSSRMRREMKTS